MSALQFTAEADTMEANELQTLSPLAVEGEVCHRVPSGDEASPNSRSVFSPLWSSDSSSVMADHGSEKVRVRLFDDYNELSDNGPPAMQLRPLTPCDDTDEVPGCFKALHYSPQSVLSYQDGYVEQPVTSMEIRHPIVRRSEELGSASSAFRPISGNGGVRALPVDSIGDDDIDQWEAPQSENAEADQFMDMDEPGAIGGCVPEAANPQRPNVESPASGAQAAFKLQDMGPGNWQPEDDQVEELASGAGSDDDHGETPESEMNDRLHQLASINDDIHIASGVPIATTAHVYDDSLDAAGSECSFRDNPEGENLVCEQLSALPLTNSAPVETERCPDGSATTAPAPAMRTRRLQVNRTGADGEDWRPLPKMGAAVRRPVAKAQSRQVDGSSEADVGRPSPQVMSQSTSDPAAGGDRRPQQRKVTNTDFSKHVTALSPAGRQNNRMTSPSGQQQSSRVNSPPLRRHVNSPPARRQLGHADEISDRREHVLADSPPRRHQSNLSQNSRQHHVMADDPPGRRHHIGDSPPVRRQHKHTDDTSTRRHHVVDSPPRRPHIHHTDDPSSRRQHTESPPDRTHHKDVPSARRLHTHVEQHHHSPSSLRHHADDPHSRPHHSHVDNPSSVGLLMRAAELSPVRHCDPSRARDIGLSPGNSNGSLLQICIPTDRYKVVSSDVGAVTSNDIDNMEQVRGHLQNMLHAAGVKGVAGYKDNTVFSLLEEDEKPSDIESAMSFPDFMSIKSTTDTSQPAFESLLNYSSKYFVPGHRGQHPQQQPAAASVSNLATENQMLREHLEQEKYRRKHCEHQIQQLQNKLLELQQQLTVSMSTDRKKDVMIEQLDKTLAKVVEGWKVREADKQEVIGKLTVENQTIRSDQLLQQQTLQQFEKELAMTVEKLADEQNRAAAADSHARHMLEEQQRGHAQLLEQLESEQEQRRLLGEERDHETETREKMERHLHEIQQSHNEERESWEEKEGDYIQKIDGVTGNHIQVMEQMMSKCDRQLKTIHENQAQLTTANREMQEIRAELESTIRERESLKVQMGMLESRMEGNLHKMLAEMRAKMEKKVTETLEEGKWAEARLEQQLLERHRVDIHETNVRNSAEMESQLTLYRRDLARHEKIIQQRDKDNKKKMEQLQEQIEKMKVHNKRIEDDRQELTNRLQSMMQAHCNETLRLLQVGSDALVQQPTQQAAATTSAAAVLTDVRQSASARLATMAMAGSRPDPAPAATSAIQLQGVKETVSEDLPPSRMADSVLLSAVSDRLGEMTQDAGDTAAGGDASNSPETQQNIVGPRLAAQPPSVDVTATSSDLNHLEAAPTVLAREGLTQPERVAMPSSRLAGVEGSLLPEVQSSLECLVPRHGSNMGGQPTAAAVSDAQWPPNATVTDMKAASTSASVNSMGREQPLTVDYMSISDKFNLHQERQAQLQHYLQMLLNKQPQPPNNSMLSDTELEQVPVQDIQTAPAATNLPSYPPLTQQQFTDQLQAHTYQEPQQQFLPMQQQQFIPMQAQPGIMQPLPELQQQFLQKQQMLQQLQLLQLLHQQQLQQLQTTGVMDSSLQAADLSRMLSVYSDVDSAMVDQQVIQQLNNIAGGRHTPQSPASGGESSAASTPRSSRTLRTQTRIPIKMMRAGADSPSDLDGSALMSSLVQVTPPVQPHHQPTPTSIHHHPPQPSSVPTTAFKPTASSSQQRQAAGIKRHYSCKLSDRPASTSSGGTGAANRSSSSGKAIWK